MVKNILVFPCGSEIGLEIYRSLKYSIHFKLFGGASVEDHGRYVFENYISGMPFVDDENFIDYLNSVIEKYKIDFIFPAHDSVVLKCAQNVNKIKCQVLTSCLDTCELTRSKLKTYTFFKDIIRVPKIFTINTITQFPVFLKPDVGQGSKGCLKALSNAEVEAATKKDSSLLILEYLPGKEYTIDCFSDINGNLCYFQGRERARIFNGISSNSFPVEDDRFEKIAQKINSSISLKGAWFFQVKEDMKGDLCLLEIAPRIAGTMELNRMQGVNLPLIWAFMESGFPIKILKNSYFVEIDRALASSYKLNLCYRTVYLDFDDCLVTNGTINYNIVAFIYKSLSQKKKIVLLTKHTHNIYETLAKYRMQNLFDNIIRIEKNDSKYKYIKDKNSIFIDDSFAERSEVFQKLNIPVFSPDMVECLL